MNKISDKQEYWIDRMLVEGYPLRVICKAAKVSKGTVQTRRDPLKWSGIFDDCRCACGQPLQNSQDNNVMNDHERKPCKKRARRSRLLLRFVALADAQRATRRASGAQGE